MIWFDDLYLNMKLYLNKKAVVAKGYDCCARHYQASRLEEEPSYLIQLTSRIHEGAKVLDIGCGCGIPLAAHLSRNFKVTGIDISLQQIKLARAAVPNATFIHGDITTQIFESGSFDHALMLFSLFHIPLDQQPALFEKIHSWLVPGGFLLISLTEGGSKGSTSKKFFGATMYWNQYSKDESLEQLQKASFSPIWEGSTGLSYHDSIKKDWKKRDLALPLILLQRI